jgi:hypothetical protein
MSRECSEKAVNLGSNSKPRRVVRIKEVSMKGSKAKIITVVSVLLIVAGGIWFSGRGKAVRSNPLSEPLRSQEAGFVEVEPGVEVPEGEKQIAQTVNLPTNTPMEVPPTPRAGLESTDPSTVALASGETQLVEFFAFW